MRATLRLVFKLNVYDEDFFWSSIIKVWKAWLKLCFNCKLFCFFSIACKCANEAKVKGFALFGLRFFGECYGGNDIDRFERYIKSSPAVGRRHCQNYKYQRCNNSHVKECVGTGLGEYIYEIKQETQQGEPYLSFFSKCKYYML